MTFDITPPRDEAPPVTLLLVDDEENVLASLRRLLRRDNYRLLCATSGQEALDILAHEKVDVIMSDQRMPYMTGTVFLRKARDLSPDSVRIVLSGYTDLQSVTEAINEGAVYKFLTKPWDDEILRLSIREALRHKWIQDENKMLHTMLVEVNAELADANCKLRSQAEFAENTVTTLHHILHDLPVPVFGIDAQGMLLLVNRAALDLLGQRSLMLGIAAQHALPPVLAAIIATPTAQQHIVEFAGTRYQVRYQPLSQPEQGHVLVLLPA